MKVSDFDFDLPEELIAQYPLKNRDDSRLLEVSRTTTSISEHKFSEIVDLIEEDSVLVINDTKVIPARLFGTKDTGGRVEVLVLKPKGEYYEVLIAPFKRIKEEMLIAFSDTFKCKVIKKLDDGIALVKFITQKTFYEELEKYGETPLPPYIHEKLTDSSRYQTVYAKHKGSAAAPTAGLHFTDDLLKKLSEKGVKIVKLTLHVGLGTFKPVKEDKIENHKMHTEEYFLSEESASLLNEQKKMKKKIYAVGTTSLRALEANYQKYHEFKATHEDTDIFIYPPYSVLSVDGLITNFHLPKSTLLFLVSAFSSKEIIKNAYEYAVKKRFRFFSFGDAMIIK